VKSISSLCLVTFLSFISFQAAQAETRFSPVDFGSVAVGENASAYQSLSFAFTDLSNSPTFSFQFGVSFRSGKVVCNPDYTSCTLSTWFVPSAPGVSRDAVVVRDSDGNLIGRMVVSGTGLGALPAFTPGVTGSRPGYFYGMGGMILDASGNLYMSDYVNNVVSKLDALDGHVTVVAGMPPVRGYSGDGDLAVNALLRAPGNLALDALGNLYISDVENHVVRRVDAVTGIISTVAGTGVAGVYGDGLLATSAQLNLPRGLAFDGAGNLFIADSANNRIRRVDAVSGRISTVAGTGSPGHSGDDGPAVSATLWTPADVAFDSHGYMYIGDTGNFVIRVVKDGIISRYAGVAGMYGSPVDGSPALTTAFNAPVNLAFDTANNLYLAEYNAVARISPLDPNTVSVIKTAYISANGVLEDPRGTIYLKTTPVQTISATGAPVQFESTHPGQTSPSKRIVLSNLGNRDLTIASIAVSGAAASEFQQKNNCESTVAPGATCNIDIVFKPSTSGARSAALVVKDNAPGGSQTIALNGTGLSAGMAVLSTTSLGFGAQALGTKSAPQTVTLSNPGTGPLRIYSITSSNAYPNVHNCGATLAPGGSCIITVWFLPIFEGSESGGMLNVSTDSSEGTRTVSFNGSVIYRYSCSVSSATLSFGKRNVSTAASTNKVTVTNTGNATVYVQSSLSGPDSSFSMGINSCRYLSPGSSCQIYVTFTPKILGPHGAELGITVSKIANTYTVVLSGYANGPIDYDRDGHRDYAIWRPDNGTWAINPSSNRFSIITQQWGLLGDIPLPGDYDGDGITDYAVWRPSDGVWYVAPGKDPSQFVTQQWGLAGDIPVKADFDGDGKLDYAVWRPSNGTWYVINSAHCEVVIQQWGLPGDVPVAGDFDGDGRADFAVWRPSEGNWYVIRSSFPSLPIVQQWGLTGDVPVPGDYDGDGRTDFAVWRPSNGIWYVITSGTGAIFGSNAGAIFRQWGLSGDVPVPEDYDGDGKTDFSVWRPTEGTWYTILSSQPLPAVRQWGLSTDVPL
jgi:sugar lactone lactonase YvrE